MADATYQPKIYRKQGGDELVVASGGVITMDDGAALRPVTGTPLITYRDPPATDDTTNTAASEAEILAGLIVKTPVAAQNWQLPTGAELSTAIGAGLIVGDSFEFTMINLGTTGDIVTLTADTGTTVIGYMGVHPAADGATLGISCGTFLFRNTGTDTWSVYRVG